MVVPSGLTSKISHALVLGFWPTQNSSPSAGVTPNINRPKAIRYARMSLLRLMQRCLSEYRSGSTGKVNFDLANNPGKATPSGEFDSQRHRHPNSSENRKGSR